MPTATPLLAPTTSTAPREVGGGVGIDVADLGVTRNGHPILHDVDLTIGSGELVAIIGASGAGKSTLLDAIAGIRPPTSGTVHIDGVRSGEPSLRHLLGYVPQDDLIHRDLPVAATLRYAARLRMPDGTPAAKIDHVVADTLDSTRSHQPGDHSCRRPQRRPAQADQHRRRAPHQTSGLLPRRAHIGPRSVDGGEPHRHAAPPRRPGHHRRAHHPQHRRPAGLRSHRRRRRWRRRLRRFPGARTRPLRRRAPRRHLPPHAAPVVADVEGRCPRRVGTTIAERRGGRRSRCRRPRSVPGR